MNTFELKNYEDIEDFLTGCAFFGTGGGGEIDAGRTALRGSLEKGHKLIVKDPKEIEDNDVFCTVFFMGSIAPKEDKILKEMDKNGFKDRKFLPTDMLVNAVDNLEKYMGKKVSGLFVAELGGSNTACCMAAAYEKGISVLDGDCSGRAVPEMGHGLPSINGKDFLPVAFVDPWGNTSITINAINYSAMERIGKMMSIASYGELAEASCFMKGNDLKESLVPYTLSECLLVGRAIKKAREECQNSSEYAAKASNGYYFGKGKITKKEAKDVDGYYQGIYNIQGMDNLKNSKFKVWFKNENHVIWENDKVVAASPDLIILLKSKDGKPISNTKLSEGEEIDIVIVPARKEFLTDKAISAFGPRYFGFDFDYKTYRE